MSSRLKFQAIRPFRAAIYGWDSIKVCAIYLSILTRAKRVTTMEFTRNFQWMLECEFSVAQRTNRRHVEFPKYCHSDLQLHGDYMFMFRPWPTWVKTFGKQVVQRLTIHQNRSDSQAVKITKIANFNVMSSS